MRSTASILHVDLDAFFASVEQRDKPSLRGKPVVVGGVGGRGVVATASYEARRFGIRSAMSTAEARSRCPHAAYLGGRFDVYTEASRAVMDTLREFTPLVQQVSFDEAFLDLAAADDPRPVEEVVELIRARVAERTGLTCSVGAASSKFLAKIASELDKPDGAFIVQPGTELEVLAPLPVTAIPGVGPATAARLHHVGLQTIEQVRSLETDELQSLLGSSSGASLYRLVRAIDDRTVVVERDTKSVSVEDTFGQDLVDRRACEAELDRLARKVATRLRAKSLSGRTVTIKVRRHDFETVTRSTTLPAPTDHPGTIADLARRLLQGADISGGIRLLGVAVSGLADWVQDDLFTPEIDDTAVEETPVEREVHWRPGMDVHHTDHGDGWVWGSGLGRVTVRFETRFTPPGRVRTFDVDDPALSPGHAPQRAAAGAGPAGTAPAGTVEP